MKFPTNINAVLHRFRYGTQLRPDRDWLVLLSVAAALIALSITWNFWLLAQVEHGQALRPSASVPSVNTAPIESVRAVFDARKQQEMRYRQEYKFVDPQQPGS